MQPYSYVVHRWASDGSEAMMDVVNNFMRGLGEDGWKLITVVPIASTEGKQSLFYFKKPTPAK